MIRRISLRTRVLVVAVVLLFIGLVAVDFAVLFRFRQPLLGRLDERLRTAAETYQVLPADVARPFAEQTARDPSDLVRGINWDFLAPDGRVIRHIQVNGDAPSDETPVLPRLDAAAVAARHGQSFYVPIAGGSIFSWRALALPLPNGDAVVVSTSMLGLRTIQKSMNKFNFTLTLILVVIIGVGGGFLIQLTLRPLRRVERTTTAIAGGDYTRRVSELGGPKTEIGKLATAMNTMLDRIEQALAARQAAEDRMRRFAAGASHELRTPLFGISGSAELYRMGATADVDATIARIEKEARRLTAIVNNLLQLTQYEDSEAMDALIKDPMDLRSLAADAIHDLHALDPSRPTTLIGPGGGRPGPAPVLGDEDKLRQVVLNLIGNVVAHTPPGSPVRIGVGTRHGDAILEVADQGPGLTAEQRGRVFEAFYRVDPSRTPHTGGAGLGLSIAHTLISQHDGHIEVDNPPEGGSVFRVRLPREPDQSEQR